MSIFNYTLPSGAEFVVRGPAGATQAQADRIFYEQVAAGALVGYESGQTLTSTATQITKFELSRLDRGTAGVDNIPVLAVIQGLASSGAGTTAQSILSNIQALPFPAGFPDLGRVPLTNPINEADIVDIKGDDFVPDAIGSNGVRALTEYQVQKLLAQLSALVNQESDQISRNKGIGRYGFTAYQLEQAGYVKPGTSLRFFSVDPEDFVSVMSSPSVWTGKNGVYGLSDLLSDALLQNRVQVQLMQQGYDQLLEAGVIVQPRTPSIQLSTGQVYTTGGLQSVQTLVGSNIFGALSRLAPTGLVPGILQNAQSPGTVLNRLLGASTVNLATIGSGAVNSLTAGLGNLSNLNVAGLSAGITNQITGSVGALVSNASKFGSQATALWAKAGSLEGISNLATAGIGNIGSTLSGLATGQLTNIAGSLSGSLGSITSNLTNLVPGSLSNLTSALDGFGKAGSFAANFANPLGNLNNLGGLLNAGGGIGGALTGQLSGLAGGLTGQLSGLTGQLSGLTGALGSLGSFANIGAVGSLFGGGGDLVSGTAVAAGFNNTVNRATLDAAFARVVGSAKVPLPIYQYPSLASLAPRLDIQQALSFLSAQSRSAGATFGQTVTI